MIRKAARLVRNGKLVAFPTETVYGLGADAFNASAVRKIFGAKGRPSDNPLIVHIADVKDLSRVARDIPEKVRELARTFWPGPLTLILHRNKSIPHAVTGGGDTVAVRIPDNRIARELIRESGTPVAAPSANRSTRPSSTSADHVLEDFSGKIPLVLDGGPTPVGVESTVLDLTSRVPSILRPGKIGREELECVVGRIKKQKSRSSKPKSPGQKYRHYAPQAQVVLVKGSAESMKKKICSAVRSDTDNGKRVGVMTFEDHKRAYPEAGAVIILGKRGNLEEVARNIFSGLRALDAMEAEVVYVESVKEGGIGEAVMDRVSRAAGSVV